MQKRFRSAALAALAFASLSLGTAQAAETITWAGCGITKKAFMAELAAGFEAKTGVAIKLEGGGATRGIRDTAKKVVHMGGSCRMALPETDSSELHVGLHPVAWDALAVIAHPDNPLDNITSEQLRGILLGTLNNWQGLGGPDQPIHSWSREGKISGVGYATRQYLFKDPGVEFQTANIAASSGPLEQAVENDRWAIGVTGVSSARKRNVKILALDGREPTYENVKSGNYDMYRPLYLISEPKPHGVVKDFIEYARSKEGREILRNAGTVPYNDALHLMSKMLIYGFGM
jgi:phosphate transport system substrate-binding protein